MMANHDIDDNFEILPSCFHTEWDELNFNPYGKVAKASLVELRLYQSLGYQDWI